MDDDGQHLRELQGRIIALELFVRGLLTDFALQSDDPAAFVDRMGPEMRDSLQQVKRPRGDEVDAIWSEAMAALDDQIDQVALRVQNILSGS